MKETIYSLTKNKTNTHKLQSADFKLHFIFSSFEFFFMCSLVSFAFAYPLHHSSQF